MPSIKCDSSGRWVYKDETSFEDIEAAEEVEFECSLCRKIDELETQLTACQQRACSELQAKIETLEATVRELAGQMLQLHKQQPPMVCENTEGHHDENKSTPQPPSETPASELNGHSQTQLRDVQANSMVSEQASAGDSLDQQGSPRGPKRTDIQDQPSLPSLTSGEIMKATETHSEESANQREPTKSGARSKRAAGKQGPKVANMKTRTDSQPQQQTTDHPSTRVDPKVNKKWVRPDPEAEREVIIVGDGNVGRIVPNVQTNVYPPKAVGFLFGKKATSEKAMHYVDTYERKARNVLRQYIVHVGLTDALRQDPCRIAQTLKTSWHNRMAKLVVCSIPEITSRGDETRAAIHLANAQLRNWCKRSRHKFLDINEGWRPDMMDKDGIHYNNTGVCSVAMKISTVAQAFLEQRRQATQAADTATPQPEKSTEVERQPDYTQGWRRTPDGNYRPTAQDTSSCDRPTSSSTAAARTANMGTDSNFPMDHPRRPKYYVSHCRGAGAAPPRDGHESAPMRRRRHPRRHKHTTPRVNVGFINLHGARRMSRVTRSVLKTKQSTMSPDLRDVWEGGDVRCRVRSESKRVGIHSRLPYQF
ncbi:hypothetical protein HPB52_022384 [Rhipicephalus sanguineus]|uniref:SGNH hydrolase-type esterase domain-containing protein n=1 Tax=Rhipicephalus sanguineus TaxID=34632 RepID=A0A9D4Q9K2_RHISA|nr:hypothetical protein HPB52_022384 [Rhipicephalus sanguineus]